MKKAVLLSILVVVMQLAAVIAERSSRRKSLG